MATETKLRQLAQGGCPVYYFYSSERYLARQAVARAAKLLAEGEDEETTVLDGAAPEIEQLIMAAGTISFFGTLWAKKLVLPLQSRRGGKLLIPTSMSGGFRGRRARLSGKQSCSALSACRPGSRKKSWWKPSTAFTATSSWTKCSRNCSKHENTANSPKKNMKKIQVRLLGDLP